VAAKPHTLPELDAVWGIGPYTCERFGREILAIVARYASRGPESSPSP
jgi:hypothetical protein